MAPWAQSPGDPSDEAEAKRLVGQTVTIGALRFDAPEPLGCARPAYQLGVRTAEMLFEGGLNADGEGRPADPVRGARSLGLAKDRFPTMTASCSEIEYVLIAPATIVFGLDNRVFTMTRAK